MEYVVTQSFQLPDALAERLEAHARATGRAKRSVIVEALDVFLEEREDLDAALARFRDPRTEWVDHDVVRRELDLD